MRDGENDGSGMTPGERRRQQAQEVLGRFKHIEPPLPLAGSCDAVEELAQVLCETAGYLWLSQQPPGATCVPVPWGHASHDLRVHYRAMARAALSAIGGRETALETAAAGVTAAWRDYYERDDGDPIHWTVRVQMLKLCAALSLPPSAAAEAVRELVKAVSAHPHPCSECTCDLCQRVRAALKPFVWKGDR